MRNNVKFLQIYRIVYILFSLKGEIRMKIRKMSPRRVKPVAKGHLFAAVVVIITLLCCEAAPDADHSLLFPSSGSSGNRSGEENKKRKIEIRFHSALARSRSCQ